MQKEKSRWKKFREALKNPPPDRLARIEYQSHFLQMGGITIVSIALIYKGLWYIIFAFIFMLGINYSQGMSALKKYKNIKEFMPKEEPKDYIKDVSPSRKRDKIINHFYGKSAKWMSIFISVFMTFLIVEIWIDPVWWARSLWYPLLIAIIFITLYFGILYKAAKYLYDKEFGE